MPGLEFLEPIVASCLQWDPGLRPTSTAVRENFSSQQSSSCTQFVQLQSQGSPQTRNTAAPIAAATPKPHEAESTELEHKPEEASGRQVGNSEPSMPSRGNPKYGKCTVDGCTSFKIRRSFECCWKHVPQYLPNEIKVSAAMARAGLLQLIWPSDLVATIVHAKAALKLGLLPFMIISFLKVPGAIARFMAELGSASTLNAEVLLRGLQAAQAGCIYGFCHFVVVCFAS